MYSKTIVWKIFKVINTYTNFDSMNISNISKVLVKMDHYQQSPILVWRDTAKEIIMWNVIRDMTCDIRYDTILYGVIYDMIYGIIYDMIYDMIYDLIYMIYDMVYMIWCIWYMIYYDMIYDICDMIYMIYDMNLYDMIYDMTYLLTAIG